MFAVPENIIAFLWLTGNNGCSRHKSEEGEAEALRVRLTLSNASVT